MKEPHTSCCLRKEKTTDFFPLEDMAKKTRRLTRWAKNIW